MLNAFRRIVASPSSSSLFYSKRLSIARMSTTADAPAAPSGPVVGKLYMYKGHSRWFRLQALAAAAGVQFDHVSDFGVRRAMTDPEFLSKFPIGTLPAFESADGKTCLTECAAICDYIASTHPESGLMGKDAGEAAQIRNWLHVCESEIIAPLTVINRAHGNMAPYDQAMVDGIKQALHRRMANIDAWLVNHPYLVGEQYTLADLELTSVLGHGFAKFFDKTWQDQYPEATAWYKKMVVHDKVKGAFGEATLIDKTPEWVPPKPKE